MWGFAKSESAGRKPAGLSGRKMWNPGLRLLRGRVGPTGLAQKPSPKPKLVLASGVRRYLCRISSEEVWWVGKRKERERRRGHVA